MQANISRFGRWVLPAILLVACTGCPSIIIETDPPPEAVLAGTWQFTTEQDTELTDTFFVFDNRGQLDKVIYKVGDNATVTDNSPRGTVTLSGNTVTISATFAGSGQVINGTLNETQDVIQGNSGTQLRIGSIEVDIDNGAITLTKQ